MTTKRPTKSASGRRLFGTAGQSLGVLLGSTPAAAGGTKCQILTTRIKRMKFKEEFVQRDQYRIYVRKYAGEEPPIILMHGFPDNLHLYDRVLPYLSPARRLITFDFLGWGASDKPAGYPYT